ncbi:MAG: heat-inducible transcriptional repressor HrcA [Peptoniphilus sp.]|nr:heat-inducible transcriptional repressor HrcA [Peptoniphilus sp.]MDD7362757.1 heat-inducible transcriptional repressor HrcA [Bacillota bacterium]MDY6044549.1 heat-inducible transcriptional repressor HrcA [Peptoniphilus sp.]
MLDQRKLDILNLIVESYIASPVPIGSRTLSKESSLSVSSATIRNEMSDLEDLGLLTKPHTSAGRIPSEDAYRFYVDELIPEIHRQDSLVELFTEAMPEKLLGTEEFYRSAIEALAEETNSLAVMMMSKKGDRTIKYLDLIALSENLVLLLVVGDRGVVVKRVLPVDFSVREDDLEYIADVLSKAFVGTSFTEIDGVKFVLSGQLVRYETFILQITSLLSDVVNVVEDIDVVISGIGNLFHYEEFQDVSRMQSLMKYVENKDNLLHIFRDVSTSAPVEFKIGSDNDAEVMQENSLLSRVYPTSASNLGKVALIGPVRMNYRKSANALVAFTDALTRRLGKER